MLMLPHGMKHFLTRAKGRGAVIGGSAVQKPRAVRARKGLGLTAQIRQHQALQARHVSVDHPMLVNIVAGRKIIRNAKGEVTVNAGEFMVLTPGVYDSYNEPEEASPYIADWIIFDPQLLREHEQLLSGPRPRPLDWMRRIEPVYEGFAHSFRASREALQEEDYVPAAVARLRLFEVLAWLREAGVHLAERDPEMDQLVRGLIASDPARSWSAAEVASAMAVSEATLRRRLAKLGTSLSAIQMDTRMSTALSLLQETDRPINHVALDVGYESASRFAIRFRQRFGFSPSDVRLRDGAIDRMCAEDERFGTTE